MGALTAPVSIVACLYGDRDYGRFVGEWADSIRALKSPPWEVIVATDRERVLPWSQRPSACTWQYPQAFYLQDAIMSAVSEWVWILDIDDRALPTALDGIEKVKEDVWQMGYELQGHGQDGETYLPPKLTPSQYLDSDKNVYVAGSAIKTEAFWRCGGFADVALQDYALWRRMAQRGASFASSDRAHFRYRRHPETRSALELTKAKRARHLAEMMESEAVALT